MQVCWKFHFIWAMLATCEGTDAFRMTDALHVPSTRTSPVIRLALWELKARTVARQSLVDLAVCIEPVVDTQIICELASSQSGSSIGEPGPVV